MDKLDIMQPLIAVNSATGDVVPVKHTGGVIGSHFKVEPTLEGGWVTFNWDGSKRYGYCPWTIHNATTTTKPSTPSNEGLTQRMEKLAQGVAAERKRHEGKVPEWYGIPTALGDLAVSIVSDLPKPVDPTDPDLIAARECVAEVYQGANLKAQAEAARAGLQDDRLRVRIARLAIARGRTLAAGGTAHE